VRGLPTVLGDHGPAVVQLEHLRRPERGHGLDRQHDADVQDHPAARAARSHVRDVRRLVHRAADPVAGVVLEQPVPEWAYDLLNGGAHVREPAAGLDRRDPGPQRPLGRGRQLEQLGCAPPHGDRNRGVAVPALQHRTAVDGNQLALLQYARARRDAVHDLGVDRGADRGRETVVAEE